MSKRILSVILLICMLVNNLPVAAFAEESTSGCSHVCDENCGYVKAVACDKDCPAGEAHAEDCAYQPGSDCTHQHNGQCGVACTHAYAEGVCTVCGMAEPQPTCGCETKCAEASESCDVCKTDLTLCIGAEPGTEESAVITVSDWEWVDEGEICNADRNVAELAGIGPWEDVLSLLPPAIRLAEGTEVAVTWECEDFAEASGTYTLTATLPEGYALEDGTNTLSLTLEMGVDSAVYACQCSRGEVIDGSFNSLGVSTGTRYYRLSSSSVTQGDKREISVKGTVYLCLHGQTWTIHSLSIQSGASLTIYDCGGSNGGTGKIITNGNYTSITNNGSLTLNGGSISGNSVAVKNSVNAKLTINGDATLSGNAYGVENFGTFTMATGTVSGNTYGVRNIGTFTMFGGTVSDTNGCAIYNSGTLNLYGNPTITGTSADIYLATGKTINVTRMLDSNYKIGVMMQTPGTFLTLGSENKSYATVENFTSDNPQYVVKSESAEDGSITFSLATARTITVTNDSSKGTVQVPTVAAEGETITVTATPSSQNMKAVVTVTAADSSAVAVTAGSEANTFTFTMPDKDVTVKVSYEELVTAYELWVAGVQVTGENLVINSEDSADITSGSATYDPTNNTLTLNNFTYTGDGGDVELAICAEGSLKIALSGENKICYTGQYAGIFITEDLTITGNSKDDKLTVDSSVGSNYSISSDGLTITNASVTADVITSLDSVTISGSEVTLTSALYVQKEGGNLSLTIKENSTVEAPKIEVWDNLVISGSEVNAECIGAVAMTVTDNSYVKAINKTNGNSAGFNVSLNLESCNINGSTVEAYGVDGAIVTFDRQNSKFNGLVPIFIGTYKIFTGADEENVTEYDPDTVSSTDFKKAYVKIVPTSAVNKEFVNPAGAGTFDVSSALAVKGETVTVTVTPEDNYRVTEVKCTTADGDVTVSKNDEGKYVFTMPGESVTVSVTFKEITCYDLWVGGVQVTSENLTINSEDNADITNGSATYDPENSTLTLNGFTYEGEGQITDNGNSRTVIESDIPLVIKLVGKNVIKITQNNINNIYDINSNAEELTITSDNKGENSLTLTGIAANGATISNVTLSVSRYIMAEDITIENSNVTAAGIGGETVTIKDGSDVKANEVVGKVDSLHSCVTVDNSDLTVTDYGDCGIKALSINITNGAEVTVKEPKGNGSGISVLPWVDIEGQTYGLTIDGNCTVEVTSNAGAFNASEEENGGLSGHAISSELSVWAGADAESASLVSSPTAATYLSKYVKIAPLPPHEHCICGDSITHTHNDPSPTWTEWNGTDAVTYDENGTAYVYLSADAARTSALAIPTGKTLNLCLNGKELKNTADNQRVIDVQGGTLNLTDCHSTGTITGGKFASGDYDMVTGIGVRVINNGTFNMYGGTISGNKNAESLQHAAGAVSVGNESYGSDGSVGTFNMYGGTISDNASFGGGGVYVNQGLFTMYNGTISGNEAGFRGGGGVLVSGNGTFTMAGGIITDNTGFSGAGVENSGTFIMTGGTITGNTGGYGGGVNNSNQFILSGNPVINDNYTDSGEASNVYLNGTITVNDTLTGADKSIGITTQDGSGKFTTGGAAYADKFVSDNSSYDVVVEGDDLALQEKHSHSYTYSAVGAEITEACTCGHSKKATLSFNDGNGSYTYTGSEIKPVQVTYDADWVGNKSTTIIYTNNINVGNANASLTIGDATANLVFTIGKAASSATAPVAKDLTYNGKAQPLVTAGTVNGGIMMYSLNGTEWSSEVPEATAAGTYTVSWKVVGDGNHNDYVSTAGIPVTISKADPDVDAPEAKTLTYTGADQTLITAGTVNGGIMMYSLNGTEWSSEVPKATAAGTYTVSWKVVGDSNHNNFEPANTVSVTIAKAPLTVKANDHEITYGEAPANNGVTYSGFMNNETENVLGGELVYTYNYAQGGNVGSYDITPKGLTSDNYKINYVPGTLTVGKAASSATAPVAKDLTYNGQAQELVIAGTVTGGSYEYSLDNTAWSAAIPAATAAGDYIVYWKIVGDGNHNDYVSTAGIPVTISQADPDVDAPEAKTLTYTGADQALITAGTVNGGIMMYSLNGTEWSSEVPEATAAGTYTVSWKVDGDSNHNNFEPANTVSVTIAKAHLTVKANDHEITYGEAPANDGVTYSGFVNNETENVLGGALVYTYNYTQGDNVGSYDITPKGLTSGNYEITYEKGTLTVKEKSVTITAGNQTITYGEDYNKSYASAEDLVPGDGLIAVTVTADKTDYPGGTLTPSDAVIKNGEKDVTANYEINYVPGTLTVGKAASSATAPVAKDLTYTGSDLELVTPGEVTGGTVYYSLKENEGFSTDIPTGKNADNYTVWYYVEGDGNHNDSAKASVSVTIAKKTLTVKANNKTITYGEEAPDNDVTCTGFINGENETVLGGELRYSSDYTKGDKVGDYTITPAGYTSDNYAITFKNGTLTVVAKPIAAEDVALSGSLTYNGIEQTKSVTVTEGITYSVEGNTATDAGTYQLTVKGTGNYTGEVKLSWSIAKAEINPTVSLKNWTYGESEKTPLVNGNSGDGKVTYSYKVKNAADETYSTNIPTAAGNYTVKAAVEETANYYGGTATADFTITKANAQVTAPAAKTLTYNGTEQNLVDAGITQHGTVKYSLSENGNYSQSVPTGMKAGTYTVWYYVEGDSNHSDSAKASVSVTIAKKTLTVKANNKTIAYGDEAANDGVTCNGFVGAESTADLKDTLTFSYSYQKGDKVGEYTITPAGYTSDNYAITFENGTLTVDKKEVTITAAAKTKVYGAEDPALTYTVSGLVSDDTVTDVKLTRNAGSNVGTYTIELETATVSDNYTLKYVSADFTITKAPLTVTAKNNTITYGDTPAGNGVTYSGFVGDDDATKLGGTLTYTYNYKQYDKAGEYTITPAGCTSGNYDITFENGKLTVGKKTITVTADAVTKVYGEEDPALTYKVSGLVNNDQLKGALSRKTGENAGEYGITKGDLSGGDNYTVVYTGADFTIEKATPTIRWATKEFTYDKQSHGEATVTLVNGESYTGTVTYTYGGKSGLPTDAGTYTVSASVSEQANYKAASATEAVTIKPKSVTPTVTLTPEIFTYDGEAKEPVVVVKDGNDVLSDTEYSVAYASNVAVGAGNAQITDKTGGNYTAATANVKFVILPDASALEGVTTENVTSANSAAIDAIQAAMANKDITGVSAEAKAAWDALEDRCENLEKAIADAATGSQTVTDKTAALPEDIKTSDLNKIDEILSKYEEIEGNLTDEQKAELADEIRELEQQKAAIEKTNADLKSVDDGTDALEANKPNLKYEDKATIKALEDKIADMEKNNAYLSESDKQDLQDQKETLEELKAEFAKADKVTDQLNALNTKAEPDDGNAVKAYEEAKKEYAQLSESDKAKVNPAAPKRLEEMKAALTAYRIISGDGAKHQLGSSRGLTIVSNGYYPHFRYVKVNGREISSSNYTSASGSTIVTLKPEYVNRLMTGKYTVTIGFGDADYIGEATANVQLYTDSGLPFTGDTIAMWVAVMAVSAGALIVVLVFAKKKSSSKK